MTPAERFEQFVDRTTTPDGCHTWTGGTYRRGYGRFTKPGGGGITATRFALELALGRALTAEEFACHACDNPPCVRVGPGHLFADTPSANTQDMIAKGRHVPQQMTGSTNGRAKLTEPQVVAIREAHAGGTTQAHLAAQYNVNPITIFRVVNRLTWNHLGAQPATE